MDVMWGKITNRVREKTVILAFDSSTLGGDVLAAIIIGIMVGYILAIPPGPIGLAAIRTGIRDGWKPSVKLAIGAGAFDVIYCALAMVATSAVVDMLSDLESSTPWAPVGLQLLIVGVMIVFGILQIREKPVERAPDTEEQKKPSNLIEWIKGHGPFFVGVGFAVANLANPTFVPALAAMATFIQQLRIFDNVFANNMIFALGFGLGNMFWLFTLVRLVIANRHKLTPTLIKRIQQVSGVTLIGFGAFYGIRIITLTDWSSLL